MARSGSAEETRLLFAPQGSRRIPGAIARELGVAILAGRYPPGAVLPGEIEASGQLQVSRSVYREAMRILSAKGVVESRPRTGTRVTQRDRWNLLDPEVLGWSFEAEPSEKFIRDLFELRLIVEPAAAELAAERRTGPLLARMEKALDEMARFGLAEGRGRAADQAFHNAVLEAADNAPLAALSSPITAAVMWTTIFKQRTRLLPRDPLPEHRALYDAIEARDVPRARAAMTELIRLALADTELSLRG